MFPPGQPTADGWTATAAAVDRSCCNAYPARRPGGPIFAADPSYAGWRRRRARPAMARIRACTEIAKIFCFFFWPALATIPNFSPECYVEAMLGTDPDAYTDEPSDAVVETQVGGTLSRLSPRLWGQGFSRCCGLQRRWPKDDQALVQENSRSAGSQRCCGGRTPSPCRGGGRESIMDSRIRAHLSANKGKREGRDIGLPSVNRPYVRREGKKKTMHKPCVPAAGRGILAAGEQGL